MTPIELFVFTLPYLGIGFLGIFIVTLVLMGSIYVLNKATAGKRD